MKRNTIAKIAVLATGLSVALLAATINPAPVAQAFPGYTSACIGCHTEGGSLTATPSDVTPAAGASYTVALAFTGGSGSSAYWISGSGASVTGSGISATMTAPAAVGTYTYTAWFRQGLTSSTTFSITVAPVVTTPPPTTIPPTTVPPTTVPPTTVPPTTIPPTTVPPTTVPPTTTAPPVILPTVSGEVNMSPTGELGIGHLSMYKSYGTMSCAACHNGTAQPQAPALSIEDADMERGVSCATCHAPGKSESDEPLFVDQMNDPAKTVYSRCSSCHQIASDGDSDGDDDGDSDDESDDGGWDGDRYGHQGDRD